MPLDFVHGASLRQRSRSTPSTAPRCGLDDLPVGLPGEAGRKAPLGNTVLLHCASDITVVLAHLKPHSVRVAAGDVVEVGRELGAVGNSGNTSEPHLHLHAVRGRVTDPALAISDAEPVLLRVDGRFPVRNDRLVVSDPLQQAQAAR
jgi:murein DD-endopeptidase MepM/ murein hydrolase activator NlpD